MKESSVTIFVPVKNAVNTIEMCVKSLFSLDYKNKKIYIVDNYSTDKTYEILKKFEKKIKLERVGGTVSSVHNHVLRNVDTEFIAYTNADCTVKKDWLKNLIGGFDSKNIVATAGYCGTPMGVNKLQELVGRELENRWKKFPKFISRAPDMNLCVRTSIAKKIRFEERFRWAWETDFGYRLNKFGKIKYVSKAIVHHYHRATWVGFFKQQMNNARMTPFLYFVKHGNRMLGDQISTSKMMIELLLGCISLLSAILFVLDFTSANFFLISTAMLLIIFIINSARLSKSVFDFLYFLAIFAVRIVAWVIGLSVGMIDLIKR